MIGHAGGHRGGHRGPSTRGSASTGRFGYRERLSQAVVGQPQMIIGQRNPSLFLEPLEIFRKSGRAPSQAPVAWSWGQVVALHNTGIAHRADRGGLSVGRDRFGLSKHHLGLDLHHPTRPTDVDDLGIRHLRRRSAPGFRWGASWTAPFRWIPLPIRR